MYCVCLEAIATYRSLLKTRGMTVKMNNIYGGQDKSVELLTDQILETRVKLLDLGTTPLVLTSMGRKIEERPTHMCGMLIVAVMSTL